MNYIVLLISFITLLIGYDQCYNPEDGIIFVVVCAICVPSMIASLLGIALDKNFFDMNF